MIDHHSSTFQLFCWIIQNAVKENLSVRVSSRNGDVNWTPDQTVGLLSLGQQDKEIL